MASTTAPAVITYHKPGVQPPLYVAGTFSHPPWQPEEMDHTAREDGEYDFRKEVRAKPRSIIQYKFRIGNGEWVLKDNEPTTTDSSGNTNHVLEVKPQEEASHNQAHNEKGARDGQGPSSNGRLSYAKVAAKHLETSAEQDANDRSGTGTPIFAKIAAEVADSAELLHEEVPERERPQGGTGEQTAKQMPDASEKASKVADAAEKHDKRQSTIVILEPPAGEGRPFRAPPRGEEFSDEQEESIADKSPLFAHECVGMYEPEENSSEGEEDDAAYAAPPFEDIDPNKVDLNDPTLERFPSNRDEIMDTVRKLETGLPADRTSFSGKPPSPVFNPSRRGTEDITGDFSLANPQSTSPTTRRASKHGPRGSVSSLNATASLHSISEDEEAAEEEDHVRPAVVFSNPLKLKPRHLNFPTSDEDEGIALREAASPRTLKPPRASIVSSEGSNPPSPKTVRKGGQPQESWGNLASAEAEIGKDKERSMQEIKLRPAPRAGNSSHEPLGFAKPGEHQNTEYTESPASYTNVASVHFGENSGGIEGASESKPAAPQPSGAQYSSESKNTTSQGPRRPSYAEVAASKAAQAETPSENTSKAPNPPDSEDRPQSSGSGKASASHMPAAGRPSYAEVAASKPPPSGHEDTPKAQPAPHASAGGEPSTSKLTTTDTTTTTTTTTGLEQDKDDSKSKDLRKRTGGNTSGSEPARTPDLGGTSVPTVHPKHGGGWIKAILRLVFVDFVGGAVKKVLRVLGLSSMLRMATGREREA
ncbi:hypothetical protein C7999DRAFT_31839 [Corynascus novoguineensis]|uniref:AMP-activated protein kinase glycogen-binding domain-containing protein n=1 Tax=Corynascus novoguineensis TaxID=1126955 RepID=A0AAN7CV10_9PEZI|nr:hypothetical protein C7999DRAFT_31839 [Corynascus novoguineensis]